MTTVLNKDSFGAYRLAHIAGWNASANETDDFPFSLYRPVGCLLAGLEHFVVRLQ
jgi:hypothetical protein